MSKFYERLWKARLAKEWSQAYLADLIGVTAPAVSAWENGRSFPTDDNLKLLRRHLGNFDGTTTTEYGEWVKKAREEKGWTVSELSRRTGISTAQIYNIESGRTSNPSHETRMYLDLHLEDGEVEDATSEHEVSDEVLEEEDAGVRVFVSYRRKDCGWAARFIASRLNETLSSDNVFIDVASISPGVPFDQRLKDAMDQCNVVLVLIGDRWLEGENGERLHEPHDNLRKEIAQALTRNVLVVPVLFDNASMPRAAQIPESLAALVARNAVTIRHDSADRDVDTLVEKLIKYRQDLGE